MPVTNIIFQGNNAGGRGGWMANRNRSHPALANVIFTGNRAANGGGYAIYDNSTPILVNVALAGNGASSGSASTTSMLAAPSATPSCGTTRA